MLKIITKIIEIKNNTGVNVLLNNSLFFCWVHCIELKYKYKYFV